MGLILRVAELCGASLSVRYKDPLVVCVKFSKLGMVSERD
jgi:hypothetical protein